MKAWCLACVAGDGFNDAAKLAGLRGGMRNCRAFMNAQEIGGDELLGFAWCAQPRAESYRPHIQEVAGAVRVKQVETHDGFSLTKELGADGVRPHGLTTLRDVRTRAFAAAGIALIDVQTLAG